MSLFSDDLDERMPEPPSPRELRRARRVRAGWIVLAVSLVIVVVLAAVPAPYVIDRPGPVFNTLGTSDHDGTQVPLISIPDQTTYPTSGALDLLTVTQVGTPSQRPDWFQIIQAWFDPSQAVLPIDVAFPPNTTSEQVNQENAALMEQSKQNAIAAALTELGYDFPREVEVTGLTNASPAEGELQKGDVITSLNGTPIDDIGALRDAVAANGTSTPAQVGVLRGGQELSVAVTPTTVQDTAVLGINVQMDYSFPFEIDIQLDNVGGPSAGQMFALGIIDKLTPGELNGGEHVAGTGTIDSAGTIGPIGGIRQKMFGAKNAGADWFLAPASNCNEVVGHVPSGLHVFSVKTLDDSLAALKAISSGGDTSGLPTCTG